MNFSDLPQQTLEALRRIFPSLDWQLRDQSEEAEQAILKFAHVYLELRSLKETLSADEFDQECRINIDLEELLLFVPMLLDSESFSSRDRYLLRNNLREIIRAFKKGLHPGVSFDEIAKAIKSGFDYGLSQPCLAKMLQSKRANCQAFSQLSLIILREIAPQHQLFLEALVPKDGVGMGHQRVVFKDPSQDIFFTFDSTWGKVEALSYTPPLQDPPEFVLLEAFLSGQNWPTDGRPELIRGGSTKLDFKSNFGVTRGYTYSDGLPTEEELLASMPARQTARKKTRFPHMKMGPVVEASRLAVAALCLSTVADTTMGLLPDGPELMTTVIVEPENREVHLIAELPEEVAELVSNQGLGLPTTTPVIDSAETDRRVKATTMLLIKDTYSERARKEKQEAEALPLFFREIRLHQIDKENAYNEAVIAEIESGIEEVSSERLLGFWTEEFAITEEPSRASFLKKWKIAWSIFLAGVLAVLIRSYKKENSLSLVE